MPDQQRIPAIARMTAKKLSKPCGHEFFFMRIQWGGRRLSLWLIVHKLAGVRSDKFAEMAHLRVFHRSK
jgi:hypothetical protein